MIFAFDSEACAMLQAAMQSPSARKSYLAMTRGDASWIQDLTVDRAIKDDTGTVREKIASMGIHRHGVMLRSFSV